MSRRTYQDAVYALTHKVEPRLAATNWESVTEDTIQHLHRIGYQLEDLNKLNVIHVAGTKGKGSTCAFSYSLLRKVAPHLKIGLYISPHIVSINERIQIDGKPISEEEFARFFFDVWDRLEATKDHNSDHPMPKFFRLLTLVAYHAFLSLGVNVTILEVGMGGRYDTTNIVPKPIITGITSLGLDHTADLGNTLSEIAWHKAGIYKTGVPAYTVNQSVEALEVIRQEAEKVQVSEFHIVDTSPEISEIKLGLAGVHQRQNATLAMHLVHRFLQLKFPTLKLPHYVSPTPDIYAAGLNEARWPGRCQQIADPSMDGLQWLLDIAHTVESMTSCAEWYFTTELAFRNTNLKRTLIFNSSRGRPGQLFLHVLLQTAAAQMKKANYEAVHPGLLFDQVIFCRSFPNMEVMDHYLKAGNVDVEASTRQQEFADAWTNLVPGYPKENVHVLLTTQDALEMLRTLHSPGELRDVLVTGCTPLVVAMISAAKLEDRVFL
ncbi:hypothetical protein OPQ81_003174 [Rhizoctonia solani]|nr:hypothetical protein OPQ81_003174 [Rhizoctonia solani]